MTTSQRGSVLLTVIAGLVLLALLGSAMLTLMTGSVMTGVDGREAMQAAYLAESGKEIVRVQTEKLDGGGLMGEAIDLETAGPISIDGKGGVKLQLFPSWFRWTGEELKSTDSGWYGGTPKGTHDWLEISKDGATRYRIDNVNAVKNDTFGSEAADLYLIGRVSGENGITYDAANNTLTVKTTENDLEWFPNSGGLIGLVSQAGKDTALPAAAQVSTHRFTYDQKTSDKGTYTFTNVTRLSSSPLSTDTFKDKDIALGQYFRVLSTGRTLNDAQAALVWHTNGRGSLRYASKDGTGNESSVVGGNTAQDLIDIFDGTFTPKKPDDDEGLVTGNNILGKLEADEDELEWKFNEVNGSNGDKIEINHFIKLGNEGGNHEYWSVAVAKPWLLYDEQNSPNLSAIFQYAFEPDDEDDCYFTGILFRLGFLSSSTSDIVTSTGTVRQGYGAKGLGVGVLQGRVTLQKNDVQTASVNPALLPGFTYTHNGKFEISNEDKVRYYGADDMPDGLLGRFIDNKNKPSIALYPLLVLWEYDDTKNGTATGSLQTLRPLAIHVLKKNTTHLSPDDYLELTVKVTEKDSQNAISIWLSEVSEKQVQAGPQWPTQNSVGDWVYVSDGVSISGNEIITTLATGNGYRRAGIFSEAYSYKNMDNEHADVQIGAFFFTGAENNVDDSDASGLTPGIVQ